MQDDIAEARGVVFNIQRLSIHHEPGVIAGLYGGLGDEFRRKVIIEIAGLHVTNYKAITQPVSSWPKLISLR
jgi:hypothetical protein